MQRPLTTMPPCTSTGNTSITSRKSPSTAGWSNTARSMTWAACKAAIRTCDTRHNTVDDNESVGALHRFSHRRMGHVRRLKNAAYSRHNYDETLLGLEGDNPLLSQQQCSHSAGRLRFGMRNATLHVLKTA